MSANVNLIVNPSFETNTTGWTASNCTLTRDSFPNVTVGTGVYSAKCVATSTAPMSIKIDVSGLTVGSPYTISFYVKTNPVSEQFSVVAAAQSQANTSYAAPSQFVRFQRRYAGFIATTTSDTIIISSSQANAVGDIMWIDCVMLNQGSKMPYFDGSYPYSSWTGTANASTSTNSVLDGFECVTDEAVIVNGVSLSTKARFTSDKNGRYTMPVVRGDNLTFPGVNGKTFVANKPIDSGLWTLNMLLLGCNNNGTTPVFQAQRTALEENFATLLAACVSDSATVDIYAWQPDGSVRTTKATLLSTTSVDPTLNMGGRRMVVALAFEILSGYWTDYLSQTVTGTAGTGWTGQYLSLPALQGGTVPIETALVTVTGPITNPLVQNDATGTYVQYTGTVSAGQSWVIDCDAWTSKVAGTSVLANTSHHGNPRFLLIDPGTMSVAPKIFLSGTGTSASTNLAVTAKRGHWTA